MSKKIMNYLSLIRVKHYIKNFLLFLPLFFSGSYKNVNNILICLIGYLLFCFVSSIVYVINDIEDIEKDRNHPTKRNRPLASDIISIKEAVALVFVLFFLCICMIFILFYMNANMWALLLPFAYLLINFLYSKGLKNYALLDVIILVSGFLIRLFFGALLIDASVSNWLYLTIMSAAFYMGFGKRRNEYFSAKGNTREVLKYYSKNFLDKSMYVCLTLTVVFYSMWTIDAQTLNKIDANYLIWTVPLLLIILFQYSLSIERDSDGDPVEVLLKNKPLIFTTILFSVLIVLIWL